MLTIFEVTLYQFQMLSAIHRKIHQGSAISMRMQSLLHHIYEHGSLSMSSVKLTRLHCFWIVLPFGSGMCLIVLLILLKLSLMPISNYLFSSMQWIFVFFSIFFSKGLNRSYSMLSYHNFSLTFKFLLFMLNIFFLSKIFSLPMPLLTLHD